MSPDLERLIGRAAADEEFFNELKNDLDGTLQKSGLNVTPQEKVQIGAIIDSINSLAQDINTLTGSQKAAWD